MLGLEIQRPKLQMLAEARKDGGEVIKSPFPYFGGKSTVADMVWSKLGRPKHYIEPFCGSAAILLRNPYPASLEVVNDANGYIANFWRAVKCQPDAVAEWADYPVSHVDLGARHRWLADPERTAALAAALADPDWPGNAKVAGWWLWGQCCWIGSGWCDWFRQRPPADNGQIPHVGNAGMGVQAAGRIPHVGNAGRGVFPLHAQYSWMRQIAERLIRVRVCHGDWHRCLNSHYGGTDTAVFLDPPYKAFCEVYGCGEIASECEAWARDNASMRICLCGHIGDYDLPGWDVVPWERSGNTYGSDKTKALECMWFSPASLKPSSMPLFDGLF
jgi:DNA adenine methylase